MRWLVLVFVVLAVTATAAQDAPQFDVASVKPSNPDARGPLGSIPIVLPPVGGRFSATNVPLRMLIRLAYGVQDFQIDGGPSWVVAERFDVQARAADGSVTMEAVQPMLKALLAERFALKVRTEARELPISALVVARGDRRLGPTMKPSSADCSGAQAQAQKLAEALAKGGPAAAVAMLPKPGEALPCSLTPVPSLTGMGLKANGVAMSALTQFLTMATGKVVQDRTGLTGLYDWEMTFDPEIMLRMAAQSGVNLPALNLPPSDSPSLLTALEEQLGLKLESARGPVEVLVIEAAERPQPD